MPLAVKELGTCDLYPQVSWCFYGLALTSLTSDVLCPEFAVLLLFTCFQRANFVQIGCKLEAHCVFLEVGVLLVYCY